jgi:hypothetical protein
MPSKMPAKSYGRGTCPSCKTRQPLTRARLITSHKRRLANGKLSGSSCVGSGAFVAVRTPMSPEIEAQRAAKLAGPHPCYDGQWTVHPAHSYTLHVANWLGGGEEMVRCPGVTAETTIQARYAR